MMYKVSRPEITDIDVNTSYEGITLEEKIRRIMNNKEPITDGAPVIYTERKNGVEPEYNIRTDRFEIAIDAMDKVTKSHQSKREERAKLGDQAKEGIEKEKLSERQTKLGGKDVGGAESTQSTD